MKFKKYFLFYSLLFCFFCKTEAQDKTLSPYFYLPCQECDTEGFPLLHTEAKVNIAGVIADVEVTQIYKNDGKQPIEAIYVFPASTRAAVYGMEMIIGERTVVAKIEEKQKARRDYNNAKQQGKRASLLEQERPNVFQMNVANIMPGDQVQVKLKYTELLIPEEGTYAFVYPTVVGPRYAGETQEELIAANDWVSNPYLSAGKKAPYSFDLNLCLKSGIPIQQLQSASHKVDINFVSKAEATVNLKPSEKAGGNRDFILEYRLKGKEIEEGLLVYEGEKENYFLMMVQPPERVQLADISGREYIFIVDISGSMRGFPLETSQKLLRDLIGKLRPSDRFNVMLFSGGSKLLSPTSVSATAANIEKAIHTISKERGGGGTNLLAAIQKAMAEPKIEGFARSFVIATDGYVNVEAATFDYIRDHLNEANFFSFGIGRSVNRFLIEGMARAGMGEPFVVTDGDQATVQADKLRRYIESPLLTDINLNFSGVEVYDQTPRKIPDLLGERPLVVFGKFKKGQKGKIELTGNTPKGVFKKNFKVENGTTTNESPALKYLWARHQIKQLGDYTNLRSRNKDHQELILEITDLGLQYNLLTKYTSFLAIDSEVVNKNGISTTVKQPLPLPDGVSNAAIGGVDKRISKNAMKNPGKAGRAWKNEPPPVVKEIPEEVIEEEEEVEFIDQSVEEKTVVRAPPPPPPTEEIFTIIEIMPVVVGCDEGSQAEQKKCSDAKMLESIYKHIKYPALAREHGVEGFVVIQFNILKDGSVSDIEIVKDIGAGCGTEALRVAKRYLPKKWIPGKQRGRSVDTKMNIPVHFDLSIPNPSVRKEKAAFEEIVVDEMPMFPGCDTESRKERKACAEKKMIKFIYSNLKYPKSLKEKAVVGTTVVRFFITKDGDLKYPIVIRSLHPELDKEVLRVVGLMPGKWTAAIRNGKSVGTNFNLPIKIKPD